MCCVHTLYPQSIFCRRSLFPTAPAPLPHPLPRLLTFAFQCISGPTKGKISSIFAFFAFHPCRRHGLMAFENKFYFRGTKCASDQPHTQLPDKPLLQPTLCHGVLFFFFRRTKDDAWRISHLEGASSSVPVP